MGRVLRPIEGQPRRLVFDHSLQMNGPAPDKLQIRERVGCLIQPKVYARMFVPQQQLAPIMEITVHNGDPGLTKIRKAEQQPLFDLFELP